MLVHKLAPKLFLLILLLLNHSIGVMGQGNNKLPNIRLKELEQRVFENPVVAKEELKDFIDQNQGAPDSLLYRAYLSLAITMGMTNSIDSGIWASNEAIRRIPDQSVDKGNALKNLSILYRIKGNYKEATKTIQMAIQLNDRHWKNKMYGILINQEYASLCLDQDDYYTATKLYIEAIKACESKDLTDPAKNITLVKLRGNLAEAYFKTQNYPFAIREFNSTLVELDQLKDYETYVVLGVKLTESYIKTNRIREADSILALMEDRLKNLNNTELQAYVDMKKGKTHATAKQYAAALTHYRKAFNTLDQNNSFVILECAIDYLNALQKSGDRNEAMQLLSNPKLQKFAQEGVIDERLAFKRLELPLIWDTLSASELYAYTQLMLQLQDSVGNDQAMKSAKILQAQYQFDRQAEQQKLLTSENNLLKQQQALKRTQLYFSISIAILSSALLGLLVVRMRQRAALKDRLLKANQVELDLQKTKREWAEQEKDLRDKLIQQQKEELVQSMEQSQLLQDQIKQIVEEQQKDQRQALLEKILNSPNEKDKLDYILSHFNTIYPAFTSNLVRLYPKISPSDVQFCVLHRINLSTKEIADLLHIETRSVYIKKYRVMEKMGLKEADNLEQILANLE